MATQVNITGGDAQRRSAKQAARQAAQGYDAAIEDLTTNWETLTAAQKQEAIRRGLVLVLRVARYLLLGRI